MWAKLTFGSCEASREEEAGDYEHAQAVRWHHGSAEAAVLLNGSRQRWCAGDTDLSDRRPDSCFSASVAWVWQTLDQVNPTQGQLASSTVTCMYIQALRLNTHVLCPSAFQRLALVMHKKLTRTYRWQQIARDARGTVICRHTDHSSDTARPNSKHHGSHCYRSVRISSLTDQSS